MPKWCKTIVAVLLLPFCAGVVIPVAIFLIPFAATRSLGTFFNGFQNIAVVDFRKELAFHRDLVFIVLGKLGPVVVTLPLAFLWRDYWALVAGIVAGSIFRVALSFAMHSYRPRIAFDGWHDLIHFSKWLLLGNLSVFIIGRSSTFIGSHQRGTVMPDSFAVLPANLRPINCATGDHRPYHP